MAYNRIAHRGFRSHRCLTVLGDVKAYKNSDFRLEEDTSTAPSTSQLGAQTTGMNLAGGHMNQHGGVEDVLRNLNAVRAAANSDMSQITEGGELAAQRRQVSAVLQHMQRRAADVAKLREQRDLLGNHSDSHQVLQMQRDQLMATQEAALQRQSGLTKEAAEKAARLSLMLNQKTGSKPQQNLANNNALELIKNRLQERQLLSQLEAGALPLERQQQLLRLIEGSRDQQVLSLDDRAALLRLEMAQRQEQDLLASADSTSSNDRALLEALLSGRGVEEPTLPTSSTSRFLDLARHGNLDTSLGAGSALSLGSDRREQAGAAAGNDRLEATLAMLKAEKAASDLRATRMAELELEQRRLARSASLAPQNMQMSNPSAAQIAQALAAGKASAVESAKPPANVASSAGASQGGQQQPSQNRLDSIMYRMFLLKEEAKHELGLR